MSRIERTLLPLLVLFTIGVAHAGELSVEECQSLLEGPPITDRRTLAQAEEVLSWIFMRHPHARGLLSRKPAVEVAFDLFYLSAGFHFAPKEGFFKNESSKNWRRLVSEKGAGKFLGPISEPSPLRHLLETSGWKNQEDPAQYRRMLSVATILGNSLSALLSLSLSDFRAGRDSREFIEVDFRTHPRAPLKTNFAIAVVNWKVSFSRKEIADLYRLHQVSESLQVRTQVVRLLEAQLENFAAEQRHMCERLEDCSTIERFLAVYHDVKDGVRPRETVSRRGSFAAVSKFNRPAAFDRGELVEFLRRSPRYGPATVDQVPWSVVLADLSQMSALMGRALLQLESWRSDKFEWVQWSQALVPTMAAVDRLQADLSHRSVEIAASNASFERGRLDFDQLRTWIDRTNDFVSSVDLGEEQVAKLPGDRLVALTQVTALLPLVRTLTDRALESARTRSVTMVENLAAMSKLLVLLVDLAEDRVRLNTGDERLDSSEKFRAIERLIHEMAKPDPESIRTRDRHD